MFLFKQTEFCVEIKRRAGRGKKEPGLRQKTTPSSVLSAILETYDPRFGLGGGDGGGVGRGGVTTGWGLGETSPGVEAGLGSGVTMGCAGAGVLP